jgi:RNA polymerase sigma-70 factor (ECF subfamily)
VLVLTSPDLSVVAAPAATPDRLFAEHAQYVWRAVRYLGVQAREVEDVSQEVFVRAFAKLRDHDPARGSMRAWLYGFCVRVVANHRRLRRHTREELDGEIDRRGVEGDHERRLGEREALLLALDTLTEEQRDVTVLHAIEEMPMTEVARVLEVPLQTAYSRYEAARQRLRQALSRGERTRGGGRG